MNTDKLVEELKKQIRSRSYADENDECNGQVIPVGDLLTIINKYSPTPSPAKEEPLIPKMGGLICPHCSKIVASPNQVAPYLPEPLACLADRKGLMIDAIGTQSSGKWFILINSKRFLESTYAECELKARAFLNQQTDVKGGM